MSLKLLRQMNLNALAELEEAGLPTFEARRLITMGKIEFRFYDPEGTKLRSMLDRLSKLEAFGKGDVDGFPRVDRETGEYVDSCLRIDLF